MKTCTVYNYAMEAHGTDIKSQKKQKTDLEKQQKLQW